MPYLYNDNYLPPNFIVMKNALCTLLFWSLVLTQIMGQATAEMPSKPVHSLSLGVGLTQIALKNETVSPLIFKGFGVPFSLTYRREKEASKHYFQLFYQSLSPTSSNNFTLNHESGGVIYGYLKRMKSWEKTHLFVGGEIQLQGFQRDYSPASNTTHMMLLNGFNVTGLMDYGLKNHKFQAQITLTGLGFNIRPKRNLYDNVVDSRFKTFVASGIFESIPNYLNASLRLSYLPPTVSKHIRWRFDYWGNFHRFKKPQYLGSLQNQVTTSLTYQF
jgi:hypothetical protein